MKVNYENGICQGHALFQVQCFFFFFFFSKKKTRKKKMIKKKKKREGFSECEWSGASVLVVGGDGYTHDYHIIKRDPSHIHMISMLFPSTSLNISLSNCSLFLPMFKPTSFVFEYLSPWKLSCTFSCKHSHSKREIIHQLFTLPKYSLREQHVSSLNSPVLVRPKQWMYTPYRLAKLMNNCI